MTKKKPQRNALHNNKKFNSKRRFKYLKYIQYWSIQIHKTTTSRCLKRHRQSHNINGGLWNPVDSITKITEEEMKQINSEHKFDTLPVWPNKHLQNTSPFKPQNIFSCYLHTKHTPKLIKCLVIKQASTFSFKNKVILTILSEHSGIKVKISVKNISQNYIEFWIT